MRGKGRFAWTSKVSSSARIGGPTTNERATKARGLCESASVIDLRSGLEQSAGRDRSQMSQSDDNVRKATWSAPRVPTWLAFPRWQQKLGHAVGTREKKSTNSSGLA